MMEMSDRRRNEVLSCTRCVRRNTTQSVATREIYWKLLVRAAIGCESLALPTTAAAYLPGRLLSLASCRVGR